MDDKEKIEETKAKVISETDLEKVTGGNFVPIYRQCPHCKKYAWFTCGTCPKCLQDIRD